MIDISDDYCKTINCCVSFTLVVRAMKRFWRLAPLILAFLLAELLVIQYQCRIEYLRPVIVANLIVVTKFAK